MPLQIKQTVKVILFTIIIQKTHHVYSLSHLDVNALGTASAPSDAPDGGEDIKEIANLMIEHKGAMDRPGFIG